MEVKFVHPFSKKRLEIDSEGNLFCEEKGIRSVFRCYDGCYDFALENPNVAETREAYDNHYGKGKITPLSCEEITAAWFDRTLSWRKTLLDSVGSFKGKRVLLLGNGESYREFYFLLLGARVVFTDLSIVATKRAKEVFLCSEFYEKYKDAIEFHAVDATHLPFPDESFDLIYGTKFVGFVPNQRELFSEIDRCLKPFGMCRFVDDAYSPAWDAFRRALVIPIKSRFLWKKMSTLERIRSGNCPTSTFGFKKEDLVPYLNEFRFSNLVFIREFFFLRVVQLIWGKFVHYDPKYIRLARPVYLLMWAIDTLLKNTDWMKRNSLSLVYGFDKKGY